MIRSIMNASISFTHSRLRLAHKHQVAATASSSSLAASNSTARHITQPAFMNASISFTNSQLRATHKNQIAATASSSSAASSTASTAATALPRTSHSHHLRSHRDIYLKVAGTKWTTSEQCCSRALFFVSPPIFSVA